MLQFFGNVIWFICGGFLSGLGYIIGGLGLCLTIIGIPFGIQNMKLGVAIFAPFGKRVEVREETHGVLNVVLNVLWLLISGWAIALSHLLLGLVLAVTLVGIPFAIQHWKLIPLALMPFGRRFVAAD